MLKSLFGNRPEIPLSKLPQPNSFVDVAVGGRSARSVSIESCGRNGIVASDVLGRPGEPASMIYAIDGARYRLHTKIASITRKSTQFEFPKRVEQVGGAGGGAQKRSSVRLDALVQGSWRFAPGGKGTGEFLKATLRDISRGGCALTADRALKPGSLIEVKINLRDNATPVVLLGEVVRHQEIRSSGKHSHGLRFHGVRPEEDHAIVEFINRKQAELRSRGLA